MKKTIDAGMVFKGPTNIPGTNREWVDVDVIEVRVLALRKSNAEWWIVTRSRDGRWDGLATLHTRGDAPTPRRLLDHVIAVGGGYGISGKRGRIVREQIEHDMICVDGLAVVSMVLETAPPLTVATATSRFCPSKQAMLAAGSDDMPF